MRVERCEQHCDAAALGGIKVEGLNDERGAGIRVLANAFAEDAAPHLLETDVRRRLRRAALGGAPRRTPRLALERAPLLAAPPPARFRGGGPRGRLRGATPLMLQLHRIAEPDEQLKEARAQ